MSAISARETAFWSQLEALLRRFLVSAIFGLLMISLLLVAGMAGYHYFESLPWIDAFTKAAMLLSGMGRLAQPQTETGKIFAGLYAFYSGLAVVLVTGFPFAPLVHWFLYRLHLETQDKSKPK